MRKGSSVLELFGETPLVRLNTVTDGVGPEIWAKCEFMNPSGSVKDRIAQYIIEDAERKGLIKPGGTIVENSSGNTGQSMAIVAAIKSYRCIITMPDKMSREKELMMKAYGAEVVVTPTAVPAESPESYYSVARRIARETEGSYYPDQYNNPVNIEAHYASTGPEIWEQMEGKIDYFIAGIGTGGTLSGVGRYLKEKDPNVKIVALDPVGSVFYDYFKTGKLPEPDVYKVEGIGEDYLVKAVDFATIDDMIQVTDDVSFLMARRLAAQEGLFVGGSSGSAVWAAVEYCRRNAIPADKKVVCILPDSGNRYLSKMYDNDWMDEFGYSYSWD